MSARATSVVPILYSLLLLTLFSSIALAQQEESLPFSFSNGAQPGGELISDPAGNLYGVTTYGGANPCKNSVGAVVGCGTVYELSPPSSPSGQWTQTELYNFPPAGNDALNPIGRLVLDVSGNLYGVSLAGGEPDSGTIYELSPPSQPGGAWTETTLCAFGFSCDGIAPQGGLTIDDLGNLYGATMLGGNFDAGVAFEMTQTQGQWFQIVLYVFTGGADDGSFPAGRLIFDPKGNLYGTTSSGGQMGEGVAFELSPPRVANATWVETVLHSFGQTTDDGTQPMAALALGPNGTLVGTTSMGGTAQKGTVFGLSPPGSGGGGWGYKVIYSFGVTPGDGANPYSSLTLITSKTGPVAYGTSSAGGNFNAGTVFQLTPSTPGSWAETPVYSFTGGRDGGAPEAGLLLNGYALYGTTLYGGIKNSNCMSGCGAAFRLSR